MDYQSALDKVNEIINSIEGKVGVAARLLDGTGKPEFSISATEVYPTASTLKVPVIYELYRQVEQGKIKLDQRIEYTDKHPVSGSGVLQDLSFGIAPTVRDLAVLMIVLSDNTATDMLFDLVGIKNVHATMSQLGLEQTQIVFTVREILYFLAGYDPNNPEHTYAMVHERLNNERSDDKSQAHNEDYSDLSTPADMVQLLTNIAQAKTLSRASCDDIIDIMSRQKYNDIIPLYLPLGVKSAHKTGSIITVRNDVGLVYPAKNPYAIALMTKQLTDEIDTMRKLARISEVIYQYFSELAD